MTSRICRMSSRRPLLWSVVSVSFAWLCLPLEARELARLEIEEPLGQTWQDEWITEEVSLDLGPGSLRVRRSRQRCDLRGNVAEPGSGSGCGRSWPGPWSPQGLMTIPKPGSYENPLWG